MSEIFSHLYGNNQPVKSLKPNFNSQHYIQAYMSLFSGTGQENRDEGNDIAHEDYPNGHALYAFDLSPDLAEEVHLNLAKQGTVRVELKFEAALANTVTVIVYAKFEKSTAMETSSRTLAVKHEH